MPYFATTDEMRFKKGFVRLSRAESDYSDFITTGMGTRVFEKEVVFDTPYPSYLGTPKVIAYVSSMIRWHGYLWNTDVDVKDITNDGFTIEFTCYDDT